MTDRNAVPAAAGGAPAVFFDRDGVVNVSPGPGYVLRVQDFHLMPGIREVLRLCRRDGSLDSAIEPDSMVANDFGSFFDSHPAIDRVFFNGAAAEKNFIRLAGVDEALHYRRLPSTSPAQTMRYEAKLRAWREALAD